MCVMQASAQEILVHGTSSGAAGLESTCISVWLGAGWSQTLYLTDCKPQVKAVRQPRHCEHAEHPMLLVICAVMQKGGKVLHLRLLIRFV